MTVLAELTIPAEEFVLAETLTAVPDMRIRYLFWRVERSAVSN